MGEQGRLFHHQLTEVQALEFNAMTKTMHYIPRLSSVSLQSSVCKEQHDGHLLLWLTASHRVPEAVEHKVCVPYAVLEEVSHCLEIVLLCCFAKRHLQQLNEEKGGLN